MSGRLRLTGKLLDSYFDTHRALRPYMWRLEYEANFVAGSGKLASWFAAAARMLPSANASWRALALRALAVRKKIDTQLP